MSLSIAIPLLAAGCQRPLVCGAQQLEPAPAAAQPHDTAGYLVYAHAHNDYEHERPLLDALEQGFRSVEADVWLRDGQIMVAHEPWSYKGTLRQLYLDPLQRRVDEQGSVYGDTTEFTLWLDLKEGSQELRDALHQLLGSYPMLTLFSDEEVREGPVTVVLTGDADSKRSYLEEHPARRACRDSNNYHVDDPAADNRWRYYALSWSSYVDWDGEGEIDPDERTRMRCITENAQRAGRRLRFFASPDTEAYWQLARETGVDFINTDRLQELATFLEGWEP